MNVRTYDSVKANFYKDNGFLDPISTLNTRKDFHIDAKKKKFDKTMNLLNAEKDGDKKNTAKIKKNLTFN